MIGKLSGLSNGKLLTSTAQITQKAESIVDTTKLLTHLENNKEKIRSWLETQGVEILVEALTRNKCEMLAEYIQLSLPLPIRLVVSKDIIADFLWKNASSVVDALS